MYVNRPLPDVERQRLKESFERGRPLGEDQWTRQMAEKLGIKHTLNPRGRPPIVEVKEEGLQ